MSSPPFKVKAVYEYTSPHEDDLHFPAGQIITVTELEDDDWYAGEYVDASDVKQEGIFPKNFVEKYEPTAPPRPTRTNRPKKEVEPAVEPAPAQPQSVEPAYEEEPEPEPEPEQEPEPEPVPEALPVRAAPPPAPKSEAVIAPLPAQAVEAPPAVPQTAPAPSKPATSPPVSEKPSGGSFRDRIAAFNKAAPPVAPFKPSGLSSGGSSNFIKKPFVAPPPSKNAYVPPPREPAPQKVYRRDEDPEIAAKESENMEQAERAGLAAPSNEDGAEEQPKPTSLKERIALLQKQQMEQAARHAEAAQKKDKPKRPPKKRAESHGYTEASEDAPGAVPERRDTEDSSARPSVDSGREEPSAPRRRKSSRAGPTTPGLHPRKSFGDGNEADMSGAGDTTEEPEEISTGRDDSDEKPRTRAPPPPARAPSAPVRQPDVGDEEGPAGSPDDEEGDDDQEEEEEEDIDPEVRRKEELRARMAKMSGGMGMHGIFGGMPMPGPSAPPKKKKSISSGTNEKRSGEYGVEDVPSAATHAPPVPMIPLPGLSRVRSPEEINRQIEQEDDSSSAITSRPADEVPDVEDVVPSHERAPPPVPSHAPDNAPPIPGGRPAPPPVPKESRPNAAHLPGPSPSAGSESDDEMSASAERSSLATPKAEAPRPLGRPESQLSPKSPTAKGTSYFGSEEVSPTSPVDQGNNRRSSRVPPIPGALTVVSPQSRAPPPPPPTTTLSRSSTGDKEVPTSPNPPAKVESEEEITEYEGDYDTDMASAVPHRDALKAHARESSLDDTSSIQPSVTMPPSAPPPLPAPAAPRAIPPPLPSQPPPNARQSADMPRAAPPPPPPSKMPAPWEQDDDEYDPYKYTAPKQSVATSNASSSRIEQREENLYSSSPPRHQAPPPQDRQAPPPPPREAGPGPGTLNRGQSRQSLDVPRSSTAGRRSVELSRISMDTGYVANDVDLGRTTYWWTQPSGIPPVFHNRKDILHEVEESSSNGGGKTTFTREVYVLYQDYSQTIITAHFDGQNPADVNLEQRHEPPPSRLRQDQLEQAHELFGRRIAEAVTSKQGTVVGDGSPQSLVQELLRPLTNSLLPVGTRAYGSVVYANLANASTQQNDEIRPGDIITLRNTKFQGKHGPMHAKYSIEVGKPDHVGIVAEWDGTKKKVRAWEQGRESKKVKMESFKLDDMRSGEVKIWRVMPRSWVGWQGQN
ncbi:SH3-domain-containing protein [Venustampulla echinocandica]|uniref:SH3-domain-containing protein n=1 Tax=Venustampulla echinocandica TaxID=2656787 RepID=A0A370TCM6_9HELO|nr:SH3-domain-containing protein [Venustampulla echinocandica]RDL31984.1 SH3-domain-containing protein [Venustampulla echinocandica]